MGVILSLIGTKDGAGATCVSLNLAALLAKEKDAKVLLLECDTLHQGDLALYTGQALKGLSDVLLQKNNSIPPTFLDGYLNKLEAGFSVMQLANNNGELPLDTTNSIAQGLAYISEGFDYIIVDCGAVLLPQHSPILLNATQNIILATPDSQHLRRIKSQYDLLLRSFIPGEKIIGLINRWPQKSQVSTDVVLSKVPTTSTGFLHEDIEAMQAAFTSQKVLYRQDPKSTFGKSLTKFYQTHLSELQAQPFSETAHQNVETEQWTKEWWPNATPQQQPKTQAIKTDADETDNLAELPTQPTTAVDQAWLDLKQSILGQLFKTMDLKKVEVGKKLNKKEEKELRDQTQEAVLKIINEMGEESIPQGQRKTLVAEVLDEALGLGPLENLLSDKSVSEIMINSAQQIYVEKGGKLQLLSMQFSSEDQLRRIIERIVAPIGRRVDESTPLVDARLPDGSRVNIIIPPLALKGPTVTIRRFSETPLQIDDLISFGSMTREMADFMRACIQSHMNVVISGGTGTGKTTLLNVASSFIPNNERIVTIEDAAELSLHQPHVVTLESRPANLEGKGQITIRDLVKNSLRMRPDRIVVGECRGGEALDMLQAMNTGHDGSMTTVHANTTKDAIARMETLVLFSGVNLPAKAIREQIASGIHLIVQLSRLQDGSRRITDIAEITGMEGTTITMQSLFRYNQTGVNAQGKVEGLFEATGFIPKAFDKIVSQGIDLKREIFTAPVRATA